MIKIAYDFNCWSFRFEGATNRLQETSELCDRSRERSRKSKMEFDTVRRKR